MEDFKSFEELSADDISEKSTQKRPEPNNSYDTSRFDEKKKIKAENQTTVVN